MAHQTRSPSSRMRRVAPALAAFLLLRCSSSSSVPRPDAAVDDDAGTSDDASPPSDGCPRAGDSRSAVIAAPAITEASGLVASAHNDQTYWVHNDSGDTARAFAVTGEGALRATLSFDTVMPADIEDMAIEDASPDVSYLYFGDIGDNDSKRTELVIHRVSEPKLDAATNVALTVVSEKMTVTYANGAHNAETLLFDPTTKDLLLATKATGGPSEIHRVGKFVAGTRVTTEKVASIDVDTATGGDISRDGSLIALRNYGTSAFVWVRTRGESLVDALARKPCKLPLASEKQGEALGFLPDGKGYVTVSEGLSPSLHFTQLP